MLRAVASRSWRGVLAAGREGEAEAHHERPVDAGLVEQPELIDEESGLGLFVPGVHRPDPRPGEPSQYRYLHTQQGQWCGVE